MDVQLILDSDNQSLDATVLGRVVSRLDGGPLGKEGEEVGAKVILLNPGDVGTPTPATRTIAIATATTNGSVAAGKRYIEFIFSSDFAGTIDGETFAGATDAVWNVPVLPGGDTYGALSYTISAGNVRITTF